MYCGAVTINGNDTSSDSKQGLHRVKYIIESNLDDNIALPSHLYALRELKLRCLASLVLQRQERSKPA